MLWMLGRLKGASTSQPSVVCEYARDVGLPCDEPRDEMFVLGQYPPACLPVEPECCESSEACECCQAGGWVT